MLDHLFFIDHMYRYCCTMTVYRSSDDHAPSIAPALAKTCEDEVTLRMSIRTADGLAG
jgi:hypothetical protein